MRLDVSNDNNCDLFVVCDVHGFHLSFPKRFMQLQCG